MDRPVVGDGGLGLGANDRATPGGLRPAAGGSGPARLQVGRSSAPQHPRVPATGTRPGQEIARTHGVQVESWGGFAEGRNNLFSDPTLGAIASTHGRSVAQVVLRWLVQRDIVLIPKSVRRERMEENRDVFDFALTDDEVARIAQMDTGASLFFDHRDPTMVSWLNSRKGI